MPESKDDLSECGFCSESFKFSSSVDKYFHFLRHYRESNLSPGRCAEVVSARDKQENMDRMARLKTLVNQFKSQSREDPTVQVNKLGLSCAKLRFSCASQLCSNGR